MDKDNQTKMPTPHEQLINELLDSRVAKTEREHAAVKEIIDLQTKRDTAIRSAYDMAERTHLLHENIEQLRKELSNIHKSAGVDWFPSDEVFNKVEKSKDGQPNILEMPDSTSYTTEKEVYDNTFHTPPPFVLCDYCEGQAIDYDESPCPECAHSILPGWLPQWYTPTEYRDFIRDVNGLPNYELPLDRLVWVLGDDGWEKNMYGLWKKHISWRRCVVVTDAGCPPENWRMW